MKRFLLLLISLCVAFLVSGVYSPVYAAPVISYDPANPPAGSTVTVTVLGCTANETARVGVGRNPRTIALNDVQVNAAGNATYTTEGVTAGEYYISAQCSAGNALGNFTVQQAGSLAIEQPIAEEDGDGKMEMGELIKIPASGCPSGGTVKFKFYYDYIYPTAVNVDSPVGNDGKAILESRFNPWTTDDAGHDAYAVYIEASCVQAGTEISTAPRVQIILQPNDNPAAIGGLHYPTEIPPPPPACANNSVTDGKCKAVDTAVGELSTEANKFVQAIFALLLSLSGGAAILIIMYAGYIYMVSRGVPEQLQKAREMIISAIVGLLFIVFSFVLMETITGDLLRLPGFDSFNQCNDRANQC